MGEHLVFADKSRGGDLRHHETGVQSGARSEKGWQTLAERRIYQSFDATFADACERTQHDSQEVQRKGQRFAMKVSARDDVTLSVVRIGNEN